MRETSNKRFIEVGDLQWWDTDEQILITANELSSYLKSHPKVDIVIRNHPEVVTAQVARRRAVKMHEARAAGLTFEQIGKFYDIDDKTVENILQTYERDHLWRTKFKNTLRADLSARTLNVITRYFDTPDWTRDQLAEIDLTALSQAYQCGEKTLRELEEYLARPTENSEMTQDVVTDEFSPVAKL